MDHAQRWTARGSRRGRVARCFFVLGLLASGLSVPGAGYAAEYRTGPAATWVKPAPVADAGEVPLGQISDGTYYLLSDAQVRLAPQGRETYRRFASKAVNGSGVEAIANIEIGFDPSYQTLTLHSIDIVRDGRVLPKLAGAKVHVLQRETALDRRILDGSKTVHVFLDDVRVGDTVDYAYTVQGGNPVFGNREAGVFRLQYAEPAQLLRARLLVPLDRDVAIKPRNAPPAPLVATRDGYREYEWSQPNATALVVDAGAPGWYAPYASVEWSEYPDWGAVARWAAPLYEVPARPGAGVQAEIDAIARQQSDPAGRMLAALRFVQSEIRYLGVEIGAGSHAPNPPALVLERRFGDCKDKALLALAMLRGLGIEARAALVATDVRRGVKEQQPMPGAFDHVLVEARINGRRFWIDPTRAPQKGDIEHLYQPDYGHALIVDPGTRALVPMANASSALSRRSIRAVFDAHAGFDKTVRYTVTTTVEGGRAEALRNTLASSNLADLQLQYLNYYARYYPKIAIAAPLEVAEDEPNNRITTTEHYDIAEFASWSESDKRHQVAIETPDMDEMLRDPTPSIRRAPLGLLHPLEVTQVTEVLLPEEWSFTPDTVRVEDAAFSFERSISGDDKHIVFADRYQARTDEVASADMPRYLESLALARDEMGYRLSWRDPAAAAGGFERFNWTIAMLGALLLLLWIHLAAGVYRYDPAAPASAVDPALQGIRGWLVLPAIGVVVTPIRLVVDFIGTTDPFAADTWAALTTHGGAAYHPLWAPFLLFELGANLALIVCSLLLAVLFFQRRRSVPLVYSTFLLGCFGVQAADLLFAAALPAASAAVDAGAWGKLFGGLFGVVAWIAYFRVSRRVQSTFIRARPQRPAVPVAVPVPAWRGLPAAEGE